MPTHPTAQGPLRTALSYPKFSAPGTVSDLTKGQHGPSAGGHQALWAGAAWSRETPCSTVPAPGPHTLPQPQRRPQTPAHSTGEAPCWLPGGHHMGPPVSSQRPEAVAATLAASLREDEGEGIVDPEPCPPKALLSKTLTTDIHSVSSQPGPFWGLQPFPSRWEWVAGNKWMMTM